MVHNYYISKRAEDEGSLKKIVETIYSPNRGLFENLFRLAPYIGPFLGVPWWQVIAAAVGTHALGLNPADFGKKLDSVLGTGPGQVMPTVSALLTNLQEYLNRSLDEMKLREATTNEMLTKEASFWSMLLKGGKVVPMFVKGVAKLLGGLLAFYGVATIDDWIRKATGTVREQVPNLLHTEKEEPKPSNIPISKRDTEDKLDTMIEQLRDKYHLNKE